MANVRTVVAIASVSLLIVTVTFTAKAQPAPATDTIGALLAEVHALRLAMERSATLAPRIQLTLARLNIQEQRSVTLGRTRSLSFQIQANNIFNTVQFATIDTVVNSPTFGEVTATRPTRRVQLVIRLRF